MDIPDIITVVRVGDKVHVTVDGQPLPFPVMTGQDMPIEIDVNPGAAMPPSIRVTIPATRVEVVNSRDIIDSPDGAVRRSTQEALSE